MAAPKVPDNVDTITSGAVKVIALIALAVIMWIDAGSGDYDAGEIPLILSLFVAGAEATQIYKKVKK